LDKESIARRSHFVDFPIMFFELAKVQFRGGRRQDVIVSQSVATGGNFDVAELESGIIAGSQK
jgi:hypothetical protein